MKAKAFKIIPQKTYNGRDFAVLGIHHLDLHTHSVSGLNVHNDPSAPLPADPADPQFKKKYVFSIDGEEFDPGQGFVCEVHQGLANYIADCHTSKYQPSLLRVSPARNEVPTGRLITQHARGSSVNVNPWMMTTLGEISQIEKGKAPVGVTSGELDLGDQIN
jgi:hypothetical protein